MSRAPSPSLAAPEAAPGYTPEAVLFEAMAVALLRTLGPKKGRAFLSAFSDEISARRDAAEAVPIHSARDPDYAAKLEAVRQAVTIFRGSVCALICACRPGRK